MIVSSNRGLAGAYNGNVLRAATAFYAAQKKAGKTIELYVAGKKGIAYVNFRKLPQGGPTSKTRHQKRPAETGGRIGASITKFPSAKPRGTARFLSDLHM